MWAARHAAQTCSCLCGSAVVSRPRACRIDNVPSLLRGRCGARAGHVTHKPAQLHGGRFSGDIECLWSTTGSSAAFCGADGSAAFQLDCAIARAALCKAYLSSVCESAATDVPGLPSRTRGQVPVAMASNHCRWPPHQKRVLLAKPAYCRCLQPHALLPSASREMCEGRRPPWYGKQEPRRGERPWRGRGRTHSDAA